VIVGVGVDVVDVARLGRSLERTPALLERLFTAQEQRIERLESLAARFAAKEAVAKALGSSGLSFLDAEVVSDESGKPWLHLHGDAAVLAESMGITRWHVSLSHDAGTATAFVVAESV